MPKDIATKENNDYFLFQDIFCGNTQAFGQHQPDTEIVKEGEKSRGKSWTVREPLSLKHYKSHLEGKTGLGIVPLNENNVKFVVIDIDNYNTVYIQNMIMKVYKNNL